MTWAYRVDPELRPSGKVPSYAQIRFTRPKVLTAIHSAHRMMLLPSFIANTNLVYVVHNTLNNKLYVGVTKNSIDRRWREHVRRSQRGGSGIFVSAIRKYGENAFEVFVFARLPTYERAKIYEKDLIAGIMPEYNMTAGGEGQVGYIYSEERKKKLSKILLARNFKHSEVSKAQISAALTGKPRLHSRKPKSLATRAKMAEARRKYWANRKGLA